MYQYPQINQLLQTLENTIVRQQGVIKVLSGYILSPPEDALVALRTLRAMNVVPDLDGGKKDGNGGKNKKIEETSGKGGGD